MTYVMADIHGNLERFNSIMKQIRLKDDDTLYILGDVIDRFPDGIKILNRIMKMPNVKMLLGNHEYMMLQALYKEYDIKDFKEVRKQKQRLSLWYDNGGKVTHDSIKHYRKDFRNKLFEYLDSLPINIDIEINGVKYKLVHGSPEENYKRVKSGYYYKNEKEFSVWERWEDGCPTPEDCVLIFGHTPTVKFQNLYPWEIWKSNHAIGIDCGSGFYQGRLACLRLDDMKEFYSMDKYSDLNWIAYREDIIRNEIELYNIFAHRGFFEDVRKRLMSSKTKEEFADSVNMSLRHHFMGKCEYEVIITNRNGRIIMTSCFDSFDIKIDVTDYNEFDWVGFYKDKSIGYDEDGIKIDVYDQIRYRFDEFVDYIWSFK